VTFQVLVSWFSTDISKIISGMKKALNRRQFAKSLAGATALISVNPFSIMKNNTEETASIKLGGPLFGKTDNPDDWIKALKESGYRAAYCPVDISASQEEIKAYKKAAKKADIIISEVGVWKNPISPDETERNEALDKCVKSLQLADEIGANCCVNTSGSRNEKYWAGPHMDNLTDETFDMIVEVTRKIVDAVNPSNTYFTLEAMPWAFPYSVDSYLRLIKAIDRKGFAVHLDPVNLVVSPEVYFNNGEMIKDCFKRLGPFIRSCHAKDIILREEIYTPHLDEIRAGLGKLDYNVFLKELSKLKDIPLMMEHLETEEEYKAAAEYIRGVGIKNGISI
jgi:sugar phosphate isomerase/epimerase